MFDEARFRQAIAKPRLRQPLPDYLPGNRAGGKVDERAGGKVKVLNEFELNAMTQQWFVDLDRKIAHYADRGIGVAFAAEWAKKYWWSWLMRDMSLNHELYTPDLRYKVIVRYIGSGHFSGTLRFYPYDESTPAIHGVGTFAQCTAVDRYHFNADGLMYEGETLFDLLDATQSAGVLPSDDSWLFRAPMGASRLPRLVQNARRTLRLG
ncbi:nuclear transport factor 2 family protein [[Mycobacterium] holstebronense]|uniref:Nuclear transport factor 2 family protein n=1 Tax=[Mycobacterium] holstebronense TaxID=3064288 RepID=A0ABM9LD19_9MYCO|nr:nuclear transport factor 2 family protein [Mycolicibacter sp. MU0102]CAJ1497003.1 nuclear transport factor 2 family protein [Mycolicibacter sp. MU0102]